MKYSLVLATAPTIEPVTLAEAKAHLRLENDMTDDDTLISSLITAAREYGEHYCKRAFITQTWDMYFDTFRCYEVKIPLSTLISVTYVKYQDSSNTQQTLSASAYTVDAYRKPGRIYPAYGNYWPATLYYPNSVNIRFIAGYGPLAADVPNVLKSAIKLLVAHLYEFREPVVSGTIVNVPFTIESLFGQEQVLEFD